MSALPPHLAHLRLPPEAERGERGPDATWAYAWPAGVRMSAELAALIDCRGRRIVDLGCGRGHLGLSALCLGAARVLFADGHADAVRHVGEVLALNDLGARATAVVHEWGAALPDGPFDLVLGGDILYRPDCFPALIATIAASLAPRGQALLSDPRQRLEVELEQLAASRSLRWRSERRDAGYTLVRLARCEAS